MPGCAARSVRCTASSPAGACGSTTCSTSRRCCCLPRRTSRWPSAPAPGLAENRLYSVALRARLPLVLHRRQHPRARKPASGCSTSAASPRGFRRRCSSSAARSRLRHSARPPRLRPPSCCPADDLLTTMSLWSSMCFAFSGFEIASMVGQEVKNPAPHDSARHHHRAASPSPRSTFSAPRQCSSPCPPASSPSVRGIADAVDLTTGRLGLAGMGAITGLLLAVGAIGGTNSWVAGVGARAVCRRCRRGAAAAFARCTSAIARRTSR